MLSYYPVIFQSFSLNYMGIGEFRILAEASADFCILCSYFPLKSCSSRRVVSGVKVEVVGAMTSPSNKSEMPGTVRVDWNDTWIWLHVPYVSICPFDGYIIPCFSKLMPLDVPSKNIIFLVGQEWNITLQLIQLFSNFSVSFLDIRLS
jgi:hypothetical protein